MTCSLQFVVFYLWKTIPVIQSWQGGGKGILTEGDLLVFCVHACRRPDGKPQTTSQLSGNLALMLKKDWFDRRRPEGTCLFYRTNKTEGILFSWCVQMVGNKNKTNPSVRLVWNLVVLTGSLRFTALKNHSKCLTTTLINYKAAPHDELLGNYG